MCTPTRASLMTGLYPQRLGQAFESALNGKRHRHLGLPSTLLTLPEQLLASGYHTAMFGKWHLGYQPPNLPTNHGFQTFIGLTSGDGDHHTHVDRSGERIGGTTKTGRRAGIPPISVPNMPSTPSRPTGRIHSFSTLPIWESISPGRDGKIRDTGKSVRIIGTTNWAVSRQRIFLNTAEA